MRKPETIGFWVGRLPHWEVEDGRYFITLHLAGAIPPQGRRRLRALSEELHRVASPTTPDWLRVQRLIFREMEHWLDTVPRVVHLQRTDIAEMVMEAIDHRTRRGDWQMFEYVVMPTHLHLFCEIGRGGLKATMEDFKRWTGHRAAKILSVDAERFWQREWFDHWSRSDEEDDRIVRYIRQNPVKARLVAEYAFWKYASWCRPRLRGGS